MALRPALTGLGFSSEPDTLADLLGALTEAPLHLFREFDLAGVPRHGAGVYATWDGTTLVYVGMSGRGMTVDTPRRATPLGLFTRLASHASGRRSGDQFCVYVADRLMLPKLTAEDIAGIAEAKISFDERVMSYVLERLAFRFLVVPDGRTALRLEQRLKEGALGTRPLLNPARGARSHTTTDTRTRSEP